MRNRTFRKFPYSRKAALIGTVYEDQILTLACREKICANWSFAKS